MILGRRPITGKRRHKFRKEIVLTDFIVDQSVDQLDSVSDSQLGVYIDDFLSILGVVLLFGVRHAILLDGLGAFRTIREVCWRTVDGDQLLPDIHIIFGFLAPGSIRESVVHIDTFNRGVLAKGHGPAANRSPRCSPDDNRIWI